MKESSWRRERERETEKGHVRFTKISYHLSFTFLLVWPARFVRIRIIRIAVTYLSLDILWSITGNAKMNIRIFRVIFFTIQKQLYFSESLDCYSLVRICIYIFLNFYSQCFPRLIYTKSCRVFSHTLKKFRKLSGVGFWNILRIYTSNLCASFVVYWSTFAFKGRFQDSEFSKHLAPSSRILRCKIRSQLFEMTTTRCISRLVIVSLCLSFSLVRRQLA